MASSMFNNLRYRETEPGTRLRAYSIGGGTRAEWNYGGDRQINGYRLDGSVTWLNFWRTNVSLNVDGRTQDLGLTRGGPSMQQPRRWEVDARLRNSSAERTRWAADVSYGRDEDGGLQFDVEAEISVRPQPRWELSVKVRRHLLVRVGPVLVRTHSSLPQGDRIRIRHACSRS